MNPDLVSIKKNVLEINHELKSRGLIIQNFGNASIRNEDKFYIKPSGVDLFSTTYEDMVEVQINKDNIFNELKPSVDYPTHQIIYKFFPEIKSIIHTHSLYATAFAQAEKEIRNLGTTQADFSYGSIPLTRTLTKEEVNNNYEENTGKTIIEEIEKKQLNCLHIPGILAIRHGVFAWGQDEQNSLKNAEIIEHLAKLNFITENINPTLSELNSYTLDKHFLRKNGPEAYYGQ
jgi:L-ribulose-5-phosphate 4-epimerase